MEQKRLRTTGLHGGIEKLQKISVIILHLNYENHLIVINLGQSIFVSRDNNKRWFYSIYPY